jgi:hypothetical protein
LLILAAIERQFHFDPVKCFAKAGDIPVAKDTEPAAAKTHFLSGDHDELVGQVADDGLRGGQAHCLIAHVRNSPLATPTALFCCDSGLSFINP